MINAFFQINAIHKKKDTYIIRCMQHIVLLAFKHVIAALYIPLVNLSICSLL